MKNRQPKIALRLGLGFGAVLLLLSLLTVLAWNGLKSSQAQLERSLDTGERAAMSDEWLASTRLNVTRVMALAKSGNDPEVDAYFKPQIAQTTARINELQQQLEAQVDSEAGRELLKDIAARRTEYIAVRKTYFDALGEGDAVRAADLLQNGLIPAVDRYIDTMGSLQQLQHALGRQAVAQARESTGRQLLWLAGLTGAALLLGLVVAWRITVSVTAPLREAVAVARTVASGDLSQRVQTQRSDELGELLAALGAMQAALVQTVSQVRSATDSINTASVEIASGNQDLSARTEQAASSLQETAASMEQITSTVRQSADAARQANQLAASAAEIAARGGQVVSEVVTTMDQISHSSRQISDIIGVIDGIAFQTNILALNAAVEAARAGEQGRGFAVVAGEVRNLAQRSAQAAKEIKGLIGSSVDRVAAGSRLVADAGQTMNDIVGSVQRVSDIIGEITAAAGEQSEGIGQVNTAVSQLDQMTQQNAALVEQSAAAAESLKDQALRLAEVVRVFRLAGGAGSPSLAALPAAPRLMAVRPTAATVAAAQARPLSVVRARATAPAPLRSHAEPLPPPARPAPVATARAAHADEGEWESF